MLEIQVDHHCCLMVYMVWWTFCFLLRIRAGASIHNFHILRAAYSRAYEVQENISSAQKEARIFFCFEIRLYRDAFALMATIISAHNNRCQYVFRPRWLAGRVVFAASSNPVSLTDVIIFCAFFLSFFYCSLAEEFLCPTCPYSHLTKKNTPNIHRMYSSEEPSGFWRLPSRSLRSSAALGWDSSQVRSPVLPIHLGSHYSAGSRYSAGSHYSIDRIACHTSNLQY